jgi:hypothetical protein
VPKVKKRWLSVKCTKCRGIAHQSNECASKTSPSLGIASKGESQKRPTLLKNQNRFEGLKVEEVPVVAEKKEMKRQEIREGKKQERVIIRSTNLEQEIFVKVSLKTDTHDQVDIKALLNCEATVVLIDREFVRRNGLKMHALPHPIRVFNVDGSPNSAGPITEEIDLMISHKGHRERVTFKVTNLGKTNVILGQFWLHKHNPEVDWRTGEVKFTRCPRECNVWLKEQSKERGTTSTCK